MNFLEKNYYKVLFMKNDIKELTGFGYIYSNYLKNKNTFISYFSKFEPGLNVKYKILIIFFFFFFAFKKISIFFKKMIKIYLKIKNCL